MTRIAAVTERCACDLGHLTLAFDHTGAEIVVHLACIGTNGRRSCGWHGPVMTLEEGEEFEILAWAQARLVATAPAVVKGLRQVATR